MINARLGVAVPAALVITLLSGCATTVQPELAPSATASPSAHATSSSPAPSAQLPADCEASITDEVRPRMAAPYAWALNPAWLEQQPNAFGFDEIVAGADAELRCAWVSPNGPSDGQIVTQFVRFAPSERVDREAAATRFAAEASDRTSVAVGQSVMVVTRWGDNTVPEGYLAAVESFAD